MSDAQNIFDNAIMLADKVLKEYIADQHKKETSDLFDFTMDVTGWLEVDINGKKFRMSLARSNALVGDIYSEEYVDSHLELSQIKDTIKQHAVIMIGMVELLYNNCLQKYMEEKWSSHQVFKKENYRLSFEEDNETSIVVSILESI